LASEPWIASLPWLPASRDGGRLIHVGFKSPIFMDLAGTLALSAA
jgi:hypothetical protein